MNYETPGRMHYSDSGAPSPSVFVLLGVPGAGKSTVASLAFEKLRSRQHTTTTARYSNLIWLDLDDCVSQEMKDNFARGIYPTLREREEFARTACAHVNEQCELLRARCAIVSFSFVNADLREKFRESFPNSTWILLNTAEDIAEERIKQRKDHFYRGKGHATEKPDSTKNVDITAKSNVDNSVWTFAPIPFAHTVLNGEDPPEANAAQIVQIVERTEKQDEALEICRDP
jgi:gluconate kinase